MKLLLLSCVLTLSACREEAPKHSPLDSGNTSQEVDRVEAFSPENQSKWTSEGFAIAGSEEWDGSTLSLPVGADLVGVRWTGELPEIPYVIRYEARRIDGVDFFGALTFPVRSSGECLTWIPGGWGGGVAGLSSINDKDASENESTQYRGFNDEQWYQFELEVRKASLVVRIDGVPHQFTLNGEKLDALPLDGLKLGLRPGPIEACSPLGVAGWQGTCEVRKMGWESL